MGKIISISGTHCTGKSTLIEALKKLPEFSEVVFLKSSGRELAAKNPGLKINEGGDFKSQFYFLTRDVQMILENQNCPLVICDRSFIDTFVYSEYLCNTGKISGTEFSILESVYLGISNLMKFDKVFLLKPSFDLVDETNRSMNKNFQNEILEMFDNKMEINWEYLPDSLEMRINEIKKELFNK